jgi:hypothetical protein
VVNIWRGIAVLPMRLHSGSRLQRTHSLTHTPPASLWQKVVAAAAAAALSLCFRLLSYPMSAATLADFWRKVETCDLQSEIFAATFAGEPAACCLLKCALLPLLPLLLLCLAGDAHSLARSAAALVF